MPTKKPPAVTTTERIEIPDINLGFVTIRIDGETPLIMNHWSEKAKTEMRDKGKKKATTAREARDPVALSEAATYFISKDPDRYGFPALGIKKAMVNAGPAVSAKMTDLRRAFHVMADAYVMGTPLIEVFGDSELFIREDPVRVKLAADLRYRPSFQKWHMEVRVRFDKGQISVAQLVNLLKQAGFSTGIGDWRPEKSGESGMFSATAVR